jgi:hypothetical protein
VQSPGTNVASQLAKLAVGEAPSPASHDSAHHRGRRNQANDGPGGVGERAIEMRGLPVPRDLVVAGRNQRRAHDPTPKPASFDKPRDRIGSPTKRHAMWPLAVAHRDQSTLGPRETTDDLPKAGGQCSTLRARVFRKGTTAKPAGGSSRNADGTHARYMSHLSQVKLFSAYLGLGTQRRRHHG